MESNVRAVESGGSKTVGLSIWAVMPTARGVPNPQVDRYDKQIIKILT